MTLLVWKSILHRKLQSLALVIAIAIGVAIIFCVVTVYQGVSSGIEISKQRLGADIVIVPESVKLEPSLVLFGGATEHTYMSKNVLNSIQSIPGIRRATPQFFTQSLSADCHDIGTQNRMLGYDPESDWVIEPWLKKLHKTELKDNEVILGAKIPIWTENRISILGKWYSIVSIAEETGTSLDYSLFVSMEEARRVASKDVFLGEVWAKQGAPTELISAILLQVDDVAKVENIAAEVQRLGNLRAIIAADIKNRINNQFTVLLLLLGGIGVLTVAASLFQLFSRFYTLTWERQAEWGLYLALGASSRNIAFIIVSETIAIALGGSLTGIVLGGGLYKASLLTLSAYQSFPFIAPSWQYMGLLSLALIVFYTGSGALAAWLPAYQGSKTDPGTVMTRGEFD